MVDNKIVQEREADHSDVREAAQEILNAGLREMGFAVDSIRHELVEKAWFGKDVKLTPDVAGDWLKDAPKDDDLSQKDQEKTFSWDALYGESPATEPDEAHRLEQEMQQDMER